MAVPDASPGHRQPACRVRSPNRTKLWVPTYCFRGTPHAWAARMVAVSSAAFESIAGKPLGFASVKASGLLGLTPELITVEVSCTRGPPLFQMVGLAEAPVREARVRIASALACLGVLMDEYAITINLAPADVPKSGAT